MTAFSDSGSGFFGDSSQYAESATSAVDDETDEAHVHDDENDDEIESENASEEDEEADDGEGQMDTHRGGKTLASIRRVFANQPPEWWPETGDTRWGDEGDAPRLRTSFKGKAVFRNPIQLGEKKELYLCDGFIYVRGKQESTWQCYCLPENTKRTIALEAFEQRLVKENRISELEQLRARLQPTTISFATTTNKRTHSPQLDVEYRTKKARTTSGPVAPVAEVPESRDIATERENIATERANFAIERANSIYSQKVLREQNELKDHNLLQLQSELAQLRNEIQNITAESHTKGDAITKLTSQLGDVRHTLQQTKVALTEGNALLDERNTLLAERDSKLEEQATEINALKERGRATLAEQETTDITVLHQQITGLDTILAGRDVQLKERAVELDTLKNRAAVHDKTLAERDAQLRELAKEIECLTERLADRDRIVDELSVLKKQLNEQEAILVERETMLKEETSQCAKLKDELDQTRDTLELQADKAASNYETLRQQLTSEITALQRQADADASNNESSRQQLTSQITELQNCVKHHQHEAVVRQRHLDESAQKLKTLAATRTEAERLRKENETVRAASSNLNVEVAKLKYQLESKQKTIDVYTATAQQELAKGDLVSEIMCEKLTRYDIPKLGLN